jgi:hypothetical protein
VSFFTIFLDGTREKFVAAAASLILFPMGWLLIRWEARGAQLPLDVAEEFASSAGYEIIVPPPPWAKRKSYEIAEQKFGSDTIPPAQLDEITRLNPNSLLILTFGGAVVGYTDFYVLKPESLEKFIGGELTERELKPEMIVPHPKRGTVTDIYMAGITVIDCHTYEGKRQASMLIWALVDLLAQCFLDERPVRLFALGWSGEGRGLLEKAGFQRIRTAKPRRDGYPLYTRSATRADCEEWLRTHRNWTGVCELRIECDLSLPPEPVRRRRSRRQAARAT